MARPRLALSDTCAPWRQLVVLAGFGIAALRAPIAGLSFQV